MNFTALSIKQPIFVTSAALLMLAAGGLLFLAGPVRAQAPMRPERPPFEASYRSEYIGSGRLREGGRDSGSAAALRQDWRVDARRPLGIGRVTFGAFYRRTDLDIGSNELVPDTLQLLRASFGYEMSARGWGIAAQLAPSLAGDRHIDARGGSLAGLLLATSQSNPRRTWVVGVAVDPRGGLPFIPLFGVVLRPNDDWTFRLQFPELAALRKTGPLFGAKSEAKAGLKFSGGGYRTSPSFGTARGRPDLDSRWVREQTLSVEAGEIFQWAHLRAEVSAGWAFLRRYEYRDVGVRVTARGAPVVGLSLGGRF